MGVKMTYQEYWFLLEEQFLKQFKGKGEIKKND